MRLNWKKIRWLLWAVASLLIAGSVLSIGMCAKFDAPGGLYWQGKILGIDLLQGIFPQPTPGITINSTTPPLTVTESGASASFTVVLNTLPTANVTIDLSLDDTSEGTFTVPFSGSSGTLTFTTGNWNTPQTVTVTGVDDPFVDGNQTFTIVIAAAVSLDADYNAINPSDIAVLNADNDSIGITVNPTSGLTVDESGVTTAQFDVVLNSQPTAAVAIALSVSDTTEGTITAPFAGTSGTLTFNPGNWSSIQTVTVVGVDDLIIDGDIPFTIVTAPAVSLDTDYSGLNPADVSLTNTDDDRAWDPPSPGGGCTSLPFRKRIEFGTSHDILYKGYTATFAMNTTSAGSNVEDTDGDDVRIMWQPAAGPAVELHRIGDSWNDAATSISFRLQSDVPSNANVDSDGDYYVYYGCNTPDPAPSDEFNVYYFADFFNRVDSTNLNANTGAGNIALRSWTVWNSSPTPGRVEINSNKLLIEAKQDSAATLGAYHNFDTSLGNSGDIPGNFIIEFDWHIWVNNLGDASESSWWYWGMNIGNKASMITSDRKTAVGPALYSCEDAAATACRSDGSNPNNIAYRPANTGMENNIKGLHSFKMVVDKSAKSYGYYRDGSGPLATGYFSDATALSDILDRIRIGADNHGLGDWHTIDNIKVYLNPTDPPETVAGTEEVSP